MSRILSFLIKISRQASMSENRVKLSIVFSRFSKLIECFSDSAVLARDLFWIRSEERGFIVELGSPFPLGYEITDVPWMECGMLFSLFEKGMHGV